LKIYCDLDSVLADFDRQYLNYFGMSIKEMEMLKGRIYAEQLIEDAGKTFWSTIPPTKDCSALWTFLNKNFKDVEILSSPGSYTHSIAGKREWCDRELGDWSGHFEKNKSKYAKPNTLLLDDYQKNINKFRDAGGLAIWYTSFNSAKLQLMAYKD
jgi:hypothetical protein